VVRLLGQQWLVWLLIPALAAGPAATWWVRGRGREPSLGYLALVWLLLLVIGWTDATVEETQAAGLLLTGSSLGLWGWFCKLRKLPSTPLPLTDQLSVCVFLATGPPAFAAAMAGPDARGGCRGYASTASRASWSPCRWASSPSCWRFSRWRRSG
jgi:hypothetical protein